MNNERLYFDVLRRIARDYDSAEKILSNSERRYGLSGPEGLEMAYDNIQTEAANAIRGKRRPVDKPAVSKKTRHEAARDMKADMYGENGK